MKAEPKFEGPGPKTTVGIENKKHKRGRVWKSSKKFEKLKGGQCGENVVSKGKSSMNCGCRARQSQTEQGRGHKLVACGSDLDICLADVFCLHDAFFPVFIEPNILKWGFDIKIWISGFS